MADRIHYVMDRQSQVLKNVQDVGIFNTSEIKDIVKKRTNYEYLIRRRELRVSDFLKYIQYEVNVDKLLNIRIANILKHENKKSNKINEFRSIRSSAICHICGIFDRAIRRFPNTQDLWNYYINFLKQKRSNISLGKVFAKALLLNPTVENFWCQAIVSSNI